MYRGCQGKGCDTKSLKVKVVQKKTRKKSSVVNTGISYDEIEIITTSPSLQSHGGFNMDSRGLSTDIDSEPDRSGPVWKLQAIIEKIEVQKFLEDQPQKIETTIWEDIMTEYEDKRLEFTNLLNISKPYEPPIPLCSKLSAVQYLDKYIFPLLCPALIDTLLKAKEWNCLMIQKCRFNGLDYLSELLWNRNPRFPKRHKEHRDIFDVPFAIIWLYNNNTFQISAVVIERKIKNIPWVRTDDANGARLAKRMRPRPIYPLSWLWSTEEAVIVMQTYIRTYLVCKEAECSEMRQFWRSLKIEKEIELRNEREKLIEKIEIIFNEIFDKIIADAVFEAEWKKHGCRCVKKPCHCVCKCMKWCKCCNCYKIPNHEMIFCECSKIKKTQ